MNIEFHRRLKTLEAEVAGLKTAFRAYVDSQALVSAQPAVEKRSTLRLPKKDAACS